MDIACGVVAEDCMGIACDAETWDTRLTLDEGWSRVDVEVPPDAWESEPWFESSLTAMPCTHDLALESSALVPREDSDLGYLVPGYSVWKWENFDLPEIVCSEFEHCLRWHNLNTTRMHYTAAVEVDVCTTRRRRFSRPESGAPCKTSMSGRAAGCAPPGVKRARLLSRPEAMMLTATQRLTAPRRVSFHPFWRPSVAASHARVGLHTRTPSLVTDI
jgi:hypothetical protein